MATLGTILYTWWKGELVGEDQFGNRYYRGKGRPPAGRAERRWTVFKGVTEASKTPPEWHAWLHRMIDTPPSEKPLPAKPWQKPHLPNLTGTEAAYRPPGDVARDDGSGGDGAHGEGMPEPYQAWRP